MKLLITALFILGIGSTAAANTTEQALRIERLEKIISLQGLDKAVKCQLKSLHTFGFQEDEKIIAIAKDQTEAAKKIKAECNERAPIKHYCQVIGEAASLLQCETASIDEVLN